MFMIMKWTKSRVLWVQIRVPGIWRGALTAIAMKVGVKLRGGLTSDAEELRSL